MDEEARSKRLKTSGGSLVLTKSEMEQYAEQAEMFELSMRQYTEYMKLLEAIELKKTRTRREQQRGEVRSKLAVALTDGLEVGY